MKRRDFVKTVVAVPAATAIAGCGEQTSLEQTALEQTALEKTALKSSTASSAAAGSSGPKELPKFAGHLIHSDMDGVGSNGLPTGQTATFSGASKAGASAEVSGGKKMTLTAEEQDILNGSQGEVLAKVMKIVVDHGNAFGAEKLVELGGAPHSSLYIGANYMNTMMAMFDECAKAGLKSYEPYTVNPRPYDLVNVNNNALDIKLIYEGYDQQRELEYVHARLGSPDMNRRSCACYVDEIGNAPPPGTFVAWAESSAVNYGNSALGLRTNRNATGMELLCALLGKAPYFGLMTDEGRMANWLVEVKVSKEPDWGLIGTAIGRKVVEGVPYITGLDPHFEGGNVTADNLHLLKAMGSATASAGAVGLYHVEGVTPDAKEKGRGLLTADYQTYVIDDAEAEAVRATFPNLWPEQDGDPTAVFVGCPHATYYEVSSLGRKFTEALDKADQEEGAIPVYFFTPNTVRDRLLEEQPALASRMKRANITLTNMCSVSYAGMKGFSERTRAVTNSAKTRNYSSARYFPDDTLAEIVVSGKVPS